jgi:uncharacterized protein YjiS (DUF1127 family)
MCAGNESSFVFNELTYDQWEHRKQQIIRRAEAARARALRGLLGAILRGLRTATWASFAAAGNWWRAYIRRRERNAAVRELHALDDRTLKDIGIHRGEIEWVVYGEDATRLRDYAPAAFNSPQTLEEILQNNDVQLFDLESDPEEMRNLALDPENNRATILRMNSLLNDLMAKEVGVNDGHFFPQDIRPK